MLDAARLALVRAREYRAPSRARGVRTGTGERISPPGRGVFRFPDSGGPLTDFSASFLTPSLESSHRSPSQSHRQ